MPLALAIDLGGTKVEAALVDETGALVEGSRHRHPTGAAAATDVAVLRNALETVIAGCRTHPRWTEVGAAGIGSAGPVDVAAGTIAPINLPAAHGFDIVSAVREASGVDAAHMRLDGTCIALAEAWLGAARGVRNAIVFVVSTGVGGGIAATLPHSASSTSSAPKRLRAGESQRTISSNSPCGELAGVVGRARQGFDAALFVKTHDQAGRVAAADGRGLHDHVDVTVAEICGHSDAVDDPVVRGGFAAATQVSGRARIQRHLRF